MSIFIMLFLAIGLSMDAFSLALIYGTLNMPNKTNNLMSIMVGIFHFFMPCIGYKLGELILSIIGINPEILVGVIFIILAIEMMISIKKEEQVKVLTNLFSVILFAFTVSVDSFSIGIGLCGISSNIYLPSIIFALTSFIFTYIGVKLGKSLANKFGNIATLIGGIILLLLGLYYLL
ncbi:MAG: hypothetical protein E7168_00115 [Firmicutes bacterium]|nr:hypothetical protein [Bacillota bacterium]